MWPGLVNDGILNLLQSGRREFYTFVPLTVPNKSRKFGVGGWGHLSPAPRL